MFAPSCARGALVVAIGLLVDLSPPASAAPQWGHEVSIGSPFPVDSGVSYNGRRGVVRSGVTNGLPSTSLGSGITVWDLTSGSGATAPTSTSLPARGETPDPYAQGNEWQPSDCVAIANTVAVTVGSGSFLGTAFGGVHDQTYIDLIHGVGGASPFIAASHLVGRTGASTEPWEEAGHVNDLELTRDGAYAIINDRNWIHRLDLVTGQLDSINIGFNWGPFPGTPGDPRNECTPNGAVDSIALTNDRAVISTSRLEFNTVRVTWVYLVDIANWQIDLEQRVAPNPLPELDLGPHDVAISLDGDVAVVTSNRMVSFFDLTNDTYIGLYYRPQFTRRYQFQVDSVEMTELYAVVLSDDTNGVTPQWHVDVFDTTALGTPIGALTSFGGSETADIPNRSHDLQITKDRTRAFVRTSFNDVVVPLAGPLPWNPTVLLSPAGSDAHLFQSYALGGPGDVFSSDSVVVQPELDPGQHAVTIGGTFDPLSSRYVAHVDFINLSTPPLAVQQLTVTAVGSGPGDFGAMPLDLDLTRDRLEVVVRSAAPWQDATPNPAAVAGGDLVFFTLTNPAPVQSHGGTGYPAALDAVSAGSTGTTSARKRVLSVSEDPILNVGLVHIVDRP